MIFKIIFAAIMVIGVSGEKALFPLKTISNVVSVFKNKTFFDGPVSVSQAKTTVSRSIFPSLPQIRYYNEYAQSSYCEEMITMECERCKTFRKDVNSIAVVRNRLLDLKAFISVSKRRKEIVIAIQGSQSLPNFLADAVFIQFGITKVKFHLGILVCMLTLYRKIVKAVAWKRKFHRTYKIIITGHSLGGAMGRMLLFFFLRRNQFPRATYEIYTYGEPRGGNKPYADYMNSKKMVSGRVVNRGDIVPHIPPVSLLGLKIPIVYDFYIHAHNEMWISLDGTVKYCKQYLYEDPTCSCSLGPKYSIPEHSSYFNLTTPCVSRESTPTKTRLDEYNRRKNKTKFPKKINKLFDVGDWFVDIKED